jgi:molybdate transport system regulatory protein
MLDCVTSAFSPLTAKSINIYCIYNIYSYKRLASYSGPTTSTETAPPFAVKQCKNTKLKSPNTAIRLVSGMCAMSYRFKLWMVSEKGESVFGDGLAELLEEISKTHSMLEAAKNLKMSYRYALHRITLAEKRLGESLVSRSHGGARGGGSSEVTPYGKSLIERYRKVQAELDEKLKTLS